jgi:hypothetical protein
MLAIGRVRVALCAALFATLAVQGAAGGSAHAATVNVDMVASPNPLQSVVDGTYTEQTADPPIATPDTPSCTETVVSHHLFQNSYYQPALGTLTPPAGCPGPWSKVVVSFSASVGGVQFDRLADVFVGAVDVFSTSTSEPCCTPGATVSWTWQKDVTEYSPLFVQTQPVTVFLNNVNDSTYTGVYDVSVGFTFYETGHGAREGAHPDVVVPVFDVNNSGGDGYFTLGGSGQTGAAAVTLPRNLLRLHAELFAQGHGPCEEFWWADPGQCAGTPYREVTVSVDGNLAGIAAVYPVVFTGGDGPGLWEPIPSPRAWNLRPYTVDLTPFVGTLVDGLPHTIALGVTGASFGSGDYWLVGANLLGWVDARAIQTTGALTSSDAPTALTESSTADPSGNGIFDVYSEQHTVSWSGVVAGSGGVVPTTVRESTSASVDETAVAQHSSWDWTTSTTTGHKTITSDSTYSLATTALTSFSFTDANTTSGPGERGSHFDETMTTAALGLAFNGAECESYSAGDADGSSYRRTLVAAAGVIVSDQPTSSCPQTQSASTSSLTTPAALRTALGTVPALAPRGAGGVDHRRTR